MRLRSKLRDELELLRRQEHGDVADSDPASRAVDDEVAGDEHVARGRPAPADERADAREQLLVRERPADDVVGTAIEGADTLDRVGRRREDDDRDVAIPGPPRLAAAQAQAELELGEEDDVRPSALRELERLRAACGSEDVEAVVAQLSAEVLPRRWLRFGDEDGARHAATLVRRGASHQMSFVEDHRQAILR